MKRFRLSLALSITLLYAIPSILWILVSDLLVQILAPNPPWHGYLSTAKGWAFVLASSLLLYTALRSVLRERERVMRDLERANTHLEAYARQQEAISRLRQHALAGARSEHLFDETVSLIALTLDADYTSLLEPQPDGETLLLRAGVGWSNGMVGQTTLPATPLHLAEYNQTWPEVLVVENIHDASTAPHFPDYTHLSNAIAHPITSSMSVALVGHEQPIGILGVHTTRQHTFPDDERRFLAAMASVLATALQREQAESELRRQKTLLECQSEASLDGILVVGSNDQTVLYNQRFVEMWNIPPEVMAERSGKSALAAVLNQLDDPQQFAQRVRYLYEHGTESSRDEVVLKSGQIFDRYSAPVQESTGYFYGRVWYYRDVTEVRRTQEAYRILVDHSLQGLVILQDGKIIFANAAMSAMNGYTLEEMQAMTPHDFDAMLHPDDRERVNTYMQDRLAGKPVPLRYEYRVFRKDGALLWLEAAVVLTQYQGRPAVQAAYLDITERKQAERRLQQVNRALKTVTACNQALIHATDETELLQQVCRIMVEVGEYRLAWVSFATTDAEKRIYPVASAGVDEGFLDQLALTWDDSTQGHGPTGTAIRVCQPCIVRNISTEPNDIPWRNEAMKRGLVSSIALPLCICMSSSYQPAEACAHQTADTPACLAALTICAADPDIFNAEEVAHLKELAADLDYGLRALRTRSEAQRTQQSLRESEERFRTLVESMDDIIFTLDTEQRHTGVFGRWIRSYGLDEAMFLGKTSYEINPDTAHLHEAANLRALTGEHVVYEWSTGDPPMHVQTWVSPLYNGDGAVSGLVGVGRDITHIKQSELALRKSNDLLQAVLSSLNEAVLLVNPHSREVYDCNRTTETMFGYSRDELVGHVTDFLHVNREMFEHFGNLSLHAYETQGFFATEFQMRRKYGEVFPTEHFNNPLYEEQNNIHMVVSVVRDITERKRAEEDLKRRNQELTALNMVIASVNRSLKLPDIIATLHMLLVDHLNISAGAILLYHEAEDILWVETAWDLAEETVDALEQRALWMLHNERIIEQRTPVVVYDLHNDATLLQALPEGTAPQGWCYLGIPLLAQGKTQGIMNLFSQDGTTCITDQVAFFVTLGQQVGSAIQNARLFAEVVQGRERMQNLSQQLVHVQEAERQAIASELHDEIGQILTGLNLTLEMVARLPMDQVYPRLDQARTIVNDLMLRVREMSLRLRPPMLDDLGLLPTLLWHFERYTSQTNIQVMLKQAGMERRFATQIETVVYRMVQEALTNVARYAEVDEVVVRLWARDDILGVQIEDQGRGFDPEVVWNRPTSSGLSSMRERLRLLGGELIIESAPGAGSCLAVELPLRSDSLQSPPLPN